MNVTAWLELELVYFEAAVHHFIHYASGTPYSLLFLVSLHSVFSFLISFHSFIFLISHAFFLDFYPPVHIPKIFLSLPFYSFFLKCCFFPPRSHFTVSFLMLLYTFFFFFLFLRSFVFIFFLRFPLFYLFLYWYFFTLFHSFIHT